MNDAPAKAPETCDELMVETIVEGRFSDAGKAIGTANVPTLQKAAQRCSEAHVAALAHALPCSQYYDRRLLCTQRIRLLTKKPDSF